MQTFYRLISAMTTSRGLSMTNTDIIIVYTLVF